MVFVVGVSTGIRIDRRVLVLTLDWVYVSVPVLGQALHIWKVYNSTEAALPVYQTQVTELRNPVSELPHRCEV